MVDVVAALRISFGAAPSMRPGITSAAFGIALLLTATVARAQAIEATPPVAAEARPWAQGVSEAEQAIALELFHAGNQEFAESRFAQALGKYREAIGHWDHPAIRFNITVVLINLDQPVEARENLVRTLAHGAVPLSADAYARAQTYQKLLDAQLGHARITCQDPGATVTLDGKLLFTRPGIVDLFLLPGEHQVVATKPGFITASKILVLVAGKLTAYDIPAIEAKPRNVRRWASWKPWAVVGGGGAIAVAGMVVYTFAGKQFAAHDRLVAAKCEGGCTADVLAMYPEIPRQKSRAENEQIFAFSLLSAGGAVLVAGLVGVVMNQSRLQLAPRLPTPAVALIPGGLQASANWRF
jgi:hypothetical protein